MTDRKPPVPNQATPSSPDESPSGMRRGLTSYGDAGFSLFLRKAFIKGAGYTDDALSRPVIGITDTASGYNPCHGNMPQLIEAVQRGILLAGGLPVRFPTISVHESFAYPTSMYLRNLMAIDTEEMIRAQPMDAVVLIGGCDKTVPAQLMGAASADIPAISLVTGSMLTGSHRGQTVGACTDCRRYWARYRAEEIDDQEIAAVNDQLVPSVGTCSVMGTASTMACVVEALGMSVPGAATPPAVTADRLRAAELTGAQAVRLAASRVTPRQILTEDAFHNAFRVLLSIGGSTNGIVHLAGQVPDIDYKSITEQTNNILTRIDKLLAEAGVDKTRLISANIWLTDAKHFTELNAAWEAWVPAGHAPTRACVQSGLMRPGIDVEIAVTALAQA